MTKNVKPVSYLILKIRFFTLFGCTVKITLDITPIYDNCQASKSFDTENLVKPWAKQ